MQIKLSEVRLFDAVDMPGVPRGSRLLQVGRHIAALTLLADMRLVGVDVVDGASYAVPIERVAYMVPDREGENDGSNKQNKRRKPDAG